MRAREAGDARGGVGWSFDLRVLCEGSVAGEVEDAVGKVGGKGRVRTVVIDQPDVDLIDVGVVLSDDDVDRRERSSNGPEGGRATEVTIDDRPRSRCRPAVVEHPEDGGGAVVEHAAAEVIAIFA